MYCDFFQLQQNPFSQNSPANSVFLPAPHHIALESLTKQVNNSCGAFLLLGTIGVGKSALIKSLIKNHSIKNSNLVFKHLNPNTSLQVSASEPSYMAKIMKSISDSRLPNNETKTKNIFILDNANNFSTPFLNRLLSKITEQNKREQTTSLILIGHPILASQLKGLQIDKSYLLNPFEEAETINYINHRLSYTQYAKQPLFNKQAIHQISKLSKGIPWNINTICSMCLFQASLDRQSIVTQETVNIATEFCLLENDSESIDCIQNQQTNNICYCAQDQQPAKVINANSALKLNKSALNSLQQSKKLIDTAA